MAHNEGPVEQKGLLRKLALASPEDRTKLIAELYAAVDRRGVKPISQDELDQEVRDLFAAVERGEIKP